MIQPRRSHRPAPRQRAYCHGLRFGSEWRRDKDLLAVKDNQPTLRQDIEDLHLEGAFPPLST